MYIDTRTDTQSYSIAARKKTFTLNHDIRFELMYSLSEMFVSCVIVSHKTVQNVVYLRTIY